MDNPKYAYSERVFNRGSEINLKLSLLQGCAVIPITDVDIVVSVYTTQLSTRFSVASYVTDITPESSRIASANGGYIRRYRDFWTLTLEPLLLEGLDVGELHLEITYRSSTIQAVDLLTLSNLY